MGKQRALIETISGKRGKEAKVHSRKTRGKRLGEYWPSGIQREEVRTASFSRGGGGWEERITSGVRFKKDLVQQGVVN